VVGSLALLHQGFYFMGYTMILKGKLEKLPMPPSVNQCYATVGRRRVSSSSLRKFKTETVMWAVFNRPHLVEVRKDIEESFKGKKVYLKFLFRFSDKKLFTKKDKIPKKIDVSNRIKPAEDMVCELLGFDDRYVFKVQAEKVQGTEEGFDVYIYLYE